MSIEGFKVRFAQRDHNPACLTEDHLLATVVQPGRADFGRELTFVAGDRGRKRFEPRYSNAEEPLGGKKIVPPPYSGEQGHRGKRVIHLPASTSEVHLAQRKHLEPLIPAQPNARGLPSTDWTRKKVVLGESGKVAGAAGEAQAYNLEASMNRKQRVGGTLERRNMIPEASAGDHGYKSADRQPGFYAEGGLVAGSTNILRPSAKPTLRKAEGAPGSQKPLEATYAKLQQRLERESDLASVLALTVRNHPSSSSIYPLSFPSLSNARIICRWSRRSRASGWPAGRSARAAGWCRPRTRLSDLPSSR